ncbi:GNAT family N-acetyltransferase [Brevundimonas lutea]|uniref:GNAT family N-acetyltransferase n=1 Tax=Brevundimonas lutea TaxID=2293980 RepID=UPI000F0305C3|nr:GNAT family N-acetyltransferase [Brevundimonas lutea]
MSATWRIDAADFADPKLIALIDHHLAEMLGFSPIGCAHALDASDLRAPDVDLFTVSEGEALLGIGALRRIDDGEFEIKSMRTHPDHLGRGVGRHLLEHLITEAARRGARRISLETGTGPVFQAALHLYRRRGFEPGPAFAHYAPTGFNQFFHLPLIPA